MGLRDWYLRQREPEKQFALPPPRNLVTPKTSSSAAPTTYDAAKDDIWPRRPVSLGEHGILRFRLDAKHTDHPLNEQGCGLTYKELHNHTSINGASGAGKTAFVFNQLIEASFRAGDLKHPADHQRLKPGYFVQDGKMELQYLVEWCAHKYGRAGDLDKIGPDCPDSAAVDPFNHPDIPVRQYADMMTTLANAMDPDQSKSDPFFENAAEKMFNYIFLLHSQLTLARNSGGIQDEIPPMSFKLLNLLLMSQLQPRNAATISAVAEAREQESAVLINNLQTLGGVLIRLEAELDTLFIIAGENPDEAGKTRLDEIHRQMHGVPNDPNSSILDNLRELSQSAPEVRGSTADDFKKTLDAALSQFAPVALRQIKSTATSLTLMRDLPGAREAKEYLFTLADLLDKILFSFNRLATLAVPKAEEGLLKDFLVIYENYLKSRHADGQEVFKHDEILNYFYVEVFDPANDKTIGSVKQTASNLTSLLSQAPFDKMFCPGGTFDFNAAIDQGRVVLLMLNFAKWQKSAKMASILYKLLFFRAALNRFKTLRADGSHINCERTFFYLVDEFATVATKGEFTGESGFLDKCRQYKIACVLAFQSFARMRDAGVSQDYIDSVMGNCSIHFHLRNGDTSTAEYISKKGGLITRAEGVLKGGTAEVLLQGENGGLREDSHMSYREQPRYQADFISELNDGEAIVRLSNYQKYQRRNTSLVQFLLHPLPRPSVHSQNKKAKPGV